MHDGARDAPAIATSGPWTRHARRVVYENPWIVVWHDEVTRPDGGPGIYGVVHFRNAASGVVVLDDSDRLLLVGQHRYTLDAYSWEIPEGGVAPDEEPLDGIRRELREETGVEASDMGRDRALRLVQFDHRRARARVAGDGPVPGDGRP